jgi:hypothetical protein
MGLPPQSDSSTLDRHYDPAKPFRKRPLLGTVFHAGIERAHETPITPRLSRKVQPPGVDKVGAGRRKSAGTSGFDRGIEAIQELPSFGDAFFVLKINNLQKEPQLINN